MIAFCDSADILEANFDSCVYEQKVLRDGSRHLKPQKFVGHLGKLQSLSGRCTCESGVHEAVVGKKATAAAAMYSSELCVAYATRLVGHFERMVEAEFLEDKIDGLTEVIEKKRKGHRAGSAADVKAKLQRLREEETKEALTEDEHLAKLKARIRRNEEEAAVDADRDPEARGSGDLQGGDDVVLISEGTKAKSKAGPTKGEENMTQLWHQAGEEGGTDPSVAWKGGIGKYGMLKKSTAFGEQAVSQVYLGGMRHPARVVRDMPGALNVGLRVRAVWERFVRQAPAVLRAAEEYGTEDCELDGALLEEWKSELRRVLGARGEQSVKLTAKGQYRSKVDPSILEAWARRANDPEVAVQEWLRHGAPLGMERSIETCGIFPPSTRRRSGGVARCRTGSLR